MALSQLRLLSDHWGPSVRWPCKPTGRSPCWSVHLEPRGTLKVPLGSKWTDQHGDLPVGLQGHRTDGPQWSERSRSCDNAIAAKTGIHPPLWLVAHQGKGSGRHRIGDV